jgi:hypothetical protein
MAQTGVSISARVDVDDVILQKFFSLEQQSERIEQYNIGQGRKTTAYSYKC